MIIFSFRKKNIYLLKKKQKQGKPLHFSKATSMHGIWLRPIGAFCLSKIVHTLIRFQNFGKKEMIFIYYMVLKFKVKKAVRL